MRLQLRSLDFYKCFVCLAAGALVFSAACRKTAVNAPDSKPPPTARATPQVPSDLPPGTVSVQNVQLTSALMNKNIPYRVVLPAGYKADDAKRFPVVYLLHGLTGHFNDWTDRGAVAQLAEKHDFIFVMPEGEDGWYTDSQLIPNSKFESYIVRELIPEIDRRFRTLSDRNHRVLAGLSMGGYGAIKFGLKFPEMFALVGSFSGALGTAAWTEHSGANQLIGKSIDMVFGPPSSAAKAKGIILDIRKNTGGNSAYGDAIGAHFLKQSLLAYRWRARQNSSAYRALGAYKNYPQYSAYALGKAFTPDEDHLVQPAVPFLAAPVAVLIGTQTYSAAEDFAQLMSQIPGVDMVGSSTAGSTGQPLIFKIGSVAFVGITAKRDLWPNGTDLIGKGVSPTIAVEETLESFHKHRDLVMEKAIELVVRRGKD